MNRAIVAFIISFIFAFLVLLGINQIVPYQGVPGLSKDDDKKKPPPGQSATPIFDKYCSL